MSRIRVLAAFALPALLGGCRSAPTRFYTLVPEAPPRPAAASPFLIEVLSVGIPAQVDLPQLVVRQDDDRVALLETEQWIAPLGDEIRAAFAEALAADLGTRDVFGLAHASDRPVYRVRLDVRRFDSAPGRYAAIDAAWSLRRAGGGSSALSCFSREREEVGAGYADLVRGHQRALAALARQVAVTLRQLATDGRATCPGD
jgi:uncharacterized lipoprotein YmbA